VDTVEITINTGRQPAAIDITVEVAGFCRPHGDGLVSVFVPHATAGVAVFETGAGSEQDVLSALDSLLPPDERRWRHKHGSPGHGRDHVVPAFVSPSMTIPVQDGRMMLGTWQSVVLVDTNVDNPVRKIRLSFLPA
jgi:secondary thiamine-phosphate synthase enzyme